MQSVSSLHCCSRFLPFFFLLVQCIITLNPSGKNDVDIGDGDAAQSVVSPLLLDGSNNPIAGSEDGLQEGQRWPTDDLFDTNAAPPLVIASTDQTDDPCPLPPMKEYSQRRKVRRGDSCTAPLQFKPEERTETKPKPKPEPKPGDNDGVSKTPGNRISPHSGPSFESTPSWKAPQKQPITRQNCPDPLLSNAVCASRIPDMTNWVERQYPGITVDLPECYLLPCFANLEPWCCAIVSLNMIKSEDGSLVLSGTLSGYTCMRMHSFPPNRPSHPSSRHGS